MVVDAVCYLHHCRALHRDIKSLNFLCKIDDGDTAQAPAWQDSTSTEVKITDFGESTIAKYSTRQQGCTCVIAPNVVSNPPSPQYHSIIGN